MSNGRLGVAILAAATDTTVYTTPVNCSYSLLTVDVLNSDSTNAVVDIALATGAVPSANEYIERNVVIAANGGQLQRSDMMCSPGERVIVKSSLATTVVRVSGREII